MYKSAIAHYKNKYPGGLVKASEGSLDVYCVGGKHRVSLQKNGAGQWVDVSDQVGALDGHDLSPLPKEACAYKLYKDGKLAPSEEYAERVEHGKKLAAHECGGEDKVPSAEDLKKAGFKIEKVEGKLSLDMAQLDK
jgi:hypothetical protein